MSRQKAGIRVETCDRKAIPERGFFHYNKDIRKVYERKVWIMTELITWAQAYGKEILTGAFFALQGLFLLLLLVNGHRIKKIRQRMDRITKQAEETLQSLQKEKTAAHTAAAGETRQIEADECHIRESRMEEMMREKIQDAKEQKEKRKTEEKNSGLISSVLREIFP